MLCSKIDIFINYLYCYQKFVPVNCNFADESGDSGEYGDFGDFNDSGEFGDSGNLVILVSVVNPWNLTIL